jgi:hypothetical protein
MNLPSFTSRFVHQGGWTTVSRTRKPIAYRLLVSAAILFFICTLLLISYGLYAFDTGSGPTPSPSLLFTVAWLPPSILGMISLGFWIFEKPKEISVKVRNHQYDPHNLY